MILSASGDRSARIWEHSGEASQSAASAQGHADKILACIFSNRALLVTGSQDKTAKVRRVQGREEEDKPAHMEHFIALTSTIRLSSCGFTAVGP